MGNCHSANDKNRQIIELNARGREVRESFAGDFTDKKAGATHSNLIRYLADLNSASSQVEELLRLPEDVHLNVRTFGMEVQQLKMHCHGLTRAPIAPIAKLIQDIHRLLTDCMTPVDAMLHTVNRADREAKVALGKFNQAVALIEICTEKLNWITDDRCCVPTLLDKLELIGRGRIGDVDKKERAMAIRDSTVPISKIQAITSWMHVNDDIMHACQEAEERVLRMLHLFKTFEPALEGFSTRMSEVKRETELYMERLDTELVALSDHLPPVKTAVVELGTWLETNVKKYYKVDGSRKFSIKSAEHEKEKIQALMQDLHVRETIENMRAQLGPPLREHGKRIEQSFTTQFEPSVLTPIAEAITAVRMMIKCVDALKCESESLNESLTRKTKPAECLSLIKGLTATFDATFAMVLGRQAQPMRATLELTQIGVLTIHQDEEKSVQGTMTQRSTATSTPPRSPSPHRRSIQERYEGLIDPQILRVFEEFEDNALFLCLDDDLVDASAA